MAAFAWLFTSTLLIAQSNEVVWVDGHAADSSRILAKFKNPGQARAHEQTLKAAEARIGRHYKLVPGLVMLEDLDAAAAGNAKATVASQQQRLAQRIEALKRTGLFEYVQADFLKFKLAEPTDSAFTNGTLWGLKNVGQFGGSPGADISATNAWDLTTGDTSVIVSVIDTGVRYDHQDLASQMWQNPNEIPDNDLDDDGNGYVDDVFGINAINDTGNPMDLDDHGTHVAGTIGASANDSGPHVGVAWNVQIMGCKFIGTFGGRTSDAIECIDYSVNMGARIMNNSWGGGPFEPALFDAIERARVAGVLFVAAAGNYRNDNDIIPFYPANYPNENVISVAAIDRKDNLANFSHWGATTVDIGAPGVEIFSSVSTATNAYDVFQGTSMAAPHVSGVAALVAAKFPGIDLDELRGRLLLGAEPTPALAGRTVTGGRVNAYKALTITGSGMLQLAITPPSGTFLLAGSTQPIFVKVTDPFGVADATVTGTISGGGNLAFANNGTPPDANAGDSVYSANFSVPAATNPVSITVVAEATNRVGNTRVLDYVVVPPPTNDDFANATKVPVGGALYRTINRFATMQPAEPLHGGLENVEGSLWWAWTPTATTQVFVDTTGSWVDTVLAIYTGNALANLTLLAATNDVPSSKQAALSFTAQAGVTYRIAVASVSANELGGIQLRVTPGGQRDTVPPTVFASLPLNGAVVTTNVIQVSGIASDPAPNATGIREVLVTVNSVMGMPASGTTNWFTPALLRPGLNSIVARAVDAAGNFSTPASIQVNYLIPGPPNDFFVNAASLNDTNVLGSVTNTAASKETGEPNHAGTFGGKSVWWKFVAEEDGLLTLSTLGSDFDTVMALYTGNGPGSLQLVASNDDADDGSHSVISHAVRAGTTYRIAVDGFDGLSGVVQLTNTFSPSAVYRLTLNATAGGDVAPATMDVVSNATIVVTATAEAGHEFDLWLGDIISIANPVSLVVRSNMTITAQFRAGGFTDDFESGNFSRLPWSTGSGAAWLIGNQVVALGQYAARSAAITHNQTSSLVLTGNFRAGTGSFSYKVSSEAGFDRLRFLVDGVVQQSWSGEAGWATFSFPLNAGVRTLEWRYSKDGGISQGADAAYLDNVILPLVLPPTSASAARLALAPQSDGTYFLNVIGQPDITYVLQLSYDLENWMSLSTNVTTSGILRLPEPTGGTNAATFYRALAVGP